MFGGVLIQKTIRSAAAEPEPVPTTLAALTTSPRKTGRGSVDVPTAVTATEGVGPWEIWTPPSPEGQYVIACDPASGEEDTGAAFAVQVIDHQSRAQVAQLEVNWEPDLVATELMLACLHYGVYRRPWLAIERTGGYGLALIDTLYHEFGYRQMYTRRKADNATGSFTDRLGWDTTKPTKSCCTRRPCSSCGRARTASAP